MHRLRPVAAGLALAVTGLHVAVVEADEFKKFHRHVKIDQALQESAGNGDGVRVGVIDTDIDVDHREFEDRIVEVIQDPDYPYFPAGNHGTQVTGVIAAARDDRGMVGIAPEARIVSTWLLDDDGDVPFVGPGGSLTSWFKRMEERNVNVVNASLGPTAGGSLFQAGGDALKAMKNMRNSAIVAIAAGNDGADLEDVSCNDGNKKFCKDPEKYFGHVLIVGALESINQLADFSNTPGNACFHRRSDGSCKDRLKRWFLVAPGTEVNSPLPGNEYRKFAGTSAAAPLVSGGAALIMSQWPLL
jgi:subtilisin family serine protease